MIYRYLLFLFYILNHPLNKDHKFKTLMKIFWWKVNNIFFHFPIIVQLTPEIKCICRANNSGYGALVAYNSLPEYGEMMFLLNSLKQNDVFIDVGANIGVFSLLASSKITNGKIYAFEPSKSILPNLYQNIFLNSKKDTIEVVEKIVSDKVGTHLFYTHDIPDYNHISNTDKKSGKVLRILATSLDRFIAENKITHIKLIKIDVEGAEFLVLKGIKKSLAAGLIDALIVEVNKEGMREFGFLPDQIFNYLTDYGFKLYYFDFNYKLKKLEDNLDDVRNIIAVRESQNIRSFE